MITNEVVIKLKGCTKKQRAEVKRILLKNYIELLDVIEREADYCTVDSYWKNFIPSGTPIVDAKTFISEKSINEEKGNAILPLVIERFNIDIPYSCGTLKRIEFKVTKTGNCEHSWLLLHGLKTGAGKDPLSIHLGRKVNALR